MSGCRFYTPNGASRRAPTLSPPACSIGPDCESERLSPVEDRDAVQRLAARVLAGGRDAHRFAVLGDDALVVLNDLAVQLSRPFDRRAVALQRHRVVIG